jgi:integrase
MEPDNLRRSWSAIRSEAGLGATRFHDLRHTYVTLLLDLGTPPHVVREIVGHSDIKASPQVRSDGQGRGKPPTFRFSGVLS